MDLESLFRLRNEDRFKDIEIGLDGLNLTFGQRVLVYWKDTNQADIATLFHLPSMDFGNGDMFVYFSNPGNNIDPVFTYLPTLCNNPNVSSIENL